MSDQAIRGGAELQAFLNALPAKMEANIMRAALRQGANVIKTEAQATLASNQSVVSGELKRGLKVSTRSKRGRVTASLKAKGKHAYLAHWIEFGVAAHGVKKGAKRKTGKLQTGTPHPGFNEKPFMRPALAGKMNEAIKAVGEAIKVRLNNQGLNASGLEAAE